MRKHYFCISENKDAVQLISTFVFATYIYRLRSKRLPSLYLTKSHGNNANILTQLKTTNKTKHYSTIKPLSHWDAMSSRLFCESIRKIVAKRSHGIAKSSHASRTGRELLARCSDISATDISATDISVNGHFGHGHFGHGKIHTFCICRWSSTVYYPSRLICSFITS